MKPQSRLVFFTFITLLVLVANLVIPTSALADDGVPPESPPPEAPVSLPEVLEQAPPDTQVVVVNDEGQVEPLATVEAAEILVTGDPVWCPGSAAPTPGANGCTAGAGTMALLITQLSGGGYSGNGTIWVESSYAGADNSSITLDHDSLTALGDLTVQGGWNGVSGNSTIGTAPVFDVALNIVNWLGNLTLSNLTFTGAGANLDSCNYNSTTGLCAGTGNITVADSTFTGSAFNGLVTDSAGNPTLTNVTASGNNMNGAFITAEDNSATAHNVTITNCTFSNNVNGTGVDVLSDGNVTLTNVIANGNNTGAIVDTTPGTGSVTVTGGQFNGNDWSGLDVYSAGNITVSNAEFSNNSYPGHDVTGAYLDATYGIGDISVTNSPFNSNDGDGLFGIANNNITLTNLTINGGGITDVGARIKAINGTATVNGGIFTNTTKVGLIAIGGVQVDLVNLNVTTNAGDGVQVTYACIGTTGIPVNVNGGTFTNNAGVPLTIKPGLAGTVTVVTPPTYSGNGGGDAMVIDLGNPCEGKDEEKPEEEGKPVNIVEVPFKGGDPVQQDCATYSGTVLMLPDGTWVEFGCPFEGSVSLEGLLEEELPGSLGAGAEFVSAIAYGMTDPEGLEVLVNPDGTITLKFKIPEDSNARAYDILYWDPSANNGAGAWVTLPQYKFGQPQAISLNPGDPEDGRLITSGVKQVGDYVTVTVNFTGTFVLVAR